MELRSEPRFETCSPAVAEVIRDKAYSFDITITEVSGMGLRIDAVEELKVGETIRLQVNKYHLFALVRSSAPSESGFRIGLERIDAWYGPAENASVSEKTAATSPVKQLGRPKLKNPLDNLHRAALQGLFANPSFRAARTKYQTVFIAAGCIALAGWAGFGAGVYLHGKPQATPAKTGAAKQVPGPTSPANIAPPKAAATNPVASESSSQGNCGAPVAQDPH